MINLDFHRSLHRRGLNHEKIARAAGVARSTVTKAINGRPGGGGARAKIAPLLTLEEKILLGLGVTETCSTGNFVPLHD